MPPAERRELLWELASGILWSSAAAALWIWMQSGLFALAFVAIVMLPAIAACLFRAVFRRPQRTLYLAKAAVWFCAAALLCGWIKYADYFAQSRALEAAAKIERFHAEQGRWPDSLAAAGIQSKGRPRLYYFPPKPPAQPAPYLFYPSAFNPIDRYFYDFDHRRFVFQPN
ncbi:Uncharacterised protein [Kingella potus]|uniref:Uncharacterized protein n=1 Tax=Kingella potus TaxID=265175 RepID=A0A377R3B5_9NEIS|nr:hypothetical protein [Kingella potus]STR02783.1 Uncharacterised protein [Kingella potus]